MSAEIFFSDDATLSVSDSTDTGLDVIAELKNVTVEIEADIVKLFSGDSTTRSAIKKREVEVPVDVEVAAFDPAFAQAWLAGDSTTTSTSYVDSTDVAEFNLDGTFTNVGGGTTWEVAVDNVAFPSIPIMPVEEGEFMAFNFSGDGETISNLDTQV